MFPTVKTLATNSFLPVTLHQKKQGYTLEWQEVKNYRFTVTESKFIYSINKLNQDQILPKIETDLSILQKTSLTNDCLQPSGFIFHMSRCGSTAFTRALAQSPHTLVYDEPYPFYTGAWQYFTNNWTDKEVNSVERQKAIKQLLLVMGKKRIATTTHYFVKFRSWNGIFIAHLAQLFPKVPFLFIYRNPIEVLVSTQKQANEFEASRPTPKGAYLVNRPLAETKQMDKITFLALSIQRMLQTALQLTDHPIAFLNYQDFNKANFASILKSAFDYVPNKEDLALMLQQFDFYSKDQTNTVQFISDSKQKLKLATPAIQQAADTYLNQLVAQLDQRKLFL